MGRPTAGRAGSSLRIRRKSLFWYETDDPVYGESGCPCYFYETPEGNFYGFPPTDGFGLKVAEHSGGQPVSDPLAVDRNVSAHDQDQVKRFLARYLPGVSRRRQHQVVCLYTMSPDEHFVLDRHPEHPQVAFVAGLSGHGFKFASALGELLGQLVLDGQTCSAAEFLGCQRFLAKR